MQKFKSVSTLTTVAMLLAIAVILGFFKIPITSFIEIRFQYLPFAIGGMLFGPAVGGVLGGLTDVLSYLVKPTGAFFPGFTIASIISGIIYGVFFYNKEVTIARVAAGTLVETIICETIIKTYCLTLLYGTPFMPLLATRALKVVVMYFINTALLYVILKPAKAQLSRFIKPSR